VIRDPLELPFDQYQRYRIVVDLLGLVRDGSKPLVILDVGGRTANLRAFLPKDRVHIVDVDPSDEPGLVLGDGSKLPYQDRSFDVVAAFDTLEHVPPAARSAFVRECARVARKWVVLAGPYRSDAVDESERLLQRFLRDKLGVEHRYLDEHRHNGLPELAASRAELERGGARTAAIGHGNLERWLPLMCLSLYLDHEPQLRELAKAVFRFYNGELYASDHASPVYRHALVGALGNAPLPTAIPGLDPPRAPAGVLERFDEVIGELASFDRARAAWSIERERLWEMTKTLAADLGGHRDALAAERDLRAEAQRSLGVLGADLAGHRAALVSAREGNLRIEKAAADERAAVEAMRGELERELALVRGALTAAERAREEDRARITRLENDADRGALEAQSLRADLTGHRESLAVERKDLAATRATLGEVRKDLAGHKTSLVEHKASLTELKASLVEHRTRAESLTRELATAREGIVTAQALLEQREMELRALRADLDGHRAVLRDVSADLEGHRAALRDTRAELETALHERNVEQQRLEGAHGELARVARILQEQDRAITVLRSDLRNRVKSLRRALGPKPPLPG